MEALKNLFTITSKLNSALKVFDKAKKDLEKVIEKSTTQYQKAQSELMEAEEVIKRANRSLGQIKKITEGED